MDNDKNEIIMIDNDSSPQLIHPNNTNTAHAETEIICTNDDSNRSLTILFAFYLIAVVQNNHPSLVMHVVADILNIIKENR